MSRSAKVSRKTLETDITVDITIEGKGDFLVKSGNGFMDHMLSLFTKHGLFDVKIACVGDTHVDFHHSAEDIGISLGMAFREALGDCKGIQRFGTCYMPMDESLSRVCLDISGRPNLVYEVTLTDRMIGTFESDLVQDFFKAFTDHAQITMHVDLIRGRNSHHCIEGIFKAFGRALSQACAINPKAREVIPSTKGVL
ncbi:imidazoleglycerol-phosphate dehydratase HisB [Chitinispirillales bacterium ANBcel5]|uniref:imidazoleglycerol-phosphate dehydratase HisB n=1 Tax=Cellulosispirillum alkaliphilum TaxID=3039283 RepID=UPI002A578BE3|nr:imidazoleglycerol-phosphate dehydratase HisB [Chitinispirillales bacterium ANBcel5]